MHPDPSTELCCVPVADIFAVPGPEKGFFKGEKGRTAGGFPRGIWDERVETAQKKRKREKSDAPLSFVFGRLGNQSWSDA